MSLTTTCLYYRVECFQFCGICLATYLYVCILSYLSACKSVEPLIWFKTCFYNQQHTHKQCLDFNTYARTYTILFQTKLHYFLQSITFPSETHMWFVPSLTVFLTKSDSFMDTFLIDGVESCRRRMCDAHADRGIRVRLIPPVAPAGTLPYLLSQKYHQLADDIINLFCVRFCIYLLIVLSVEKYILGCDIFPKISEEPTVSIFRVGP
jgi:hypothetical protein